MRNCPNCGYRLAFVAGDEAAHLCPGDLERRDNRRVWIVPRLSGSCHECGEAFRPGDSRAEVYLDDAPDSAFGPFLVHQEPCYLQNEDKYQLA